MDNPSLMKQVQTVQDHVQPAPQHVPAQNFVWVHPLDLRPGEAQKVENQALVDTCRTLKIKVIQWQPEYP
jgi:hypothetical protein